MPTKDELEAENAELREELARLREHDSANVVPPKRPERPDYLSAGEADDLRNNGVTVSPFNGATLICYDFGIEPANADARRLADKARADRKADPGTEEPAPE